MLADAFVRAGKVRDLYRLGDDRLVLVASDRISAFDVVLPTPVPDKGRVLTALSRWWFARLEGIVAGHLLSTDPETASAVVGAAPDELRGRVMICRRADVLPAEIVVRGYLAGSGWRDYRTGGQVSGVPLPAGLRESERLPAPILTPSTKAEAGHDQPMAYRELVRLVGEATAERVRDVALALYREAAAVTSRAGILLADTKFEFGIDPDTGELLLVDEVLTPDSSRFWDAATYAPGGGQASFDKQFVRDWLESAPWDKTPPGPELPPAVVAGTRQRYVEAFERITGSSFARYLAEDVVG